MIIQINVWICDRCGQVETTHGEVMMYDDPVVTHHEGWDYAEDDLMCPRCVSFRKKGVG